MADLIGDQPYLVSIHQKNVFFCYENKTEKLGLENICICGYEKMHGRILQVLIRLLKRDRNMFFKPVVRCYFFLKPILFRHDITYWWDEEGYFVLRVRILNRYFKRVGDYYMNENWYNLYMMYGENNIGQRDPCASSHNFLNNRAHCIVDPQKFELLNNTQTDVLHVSDLNFLYYDACYYRT